MLQGPAGELEARLDFPAVTQDGGKRADPRRRPRVRRNHAIRTLCLAARLTNKVVHTLARAFNEAGMPSLRFNFRGVGASAGTHDEGRGEVPGCAGGGALLP